MAENEVVIKDETFDYDKFLDKFEERQEAKAAKEAELLSAISKARAEGKEEGLAAKAEELKAWAEEKGAPLVMKEAKLGDGKGADVDAFAYWLRTGDAGAAKSLVAAQGKAWGLSDEATAELMKTSRGRKALQEGTGSEGGFLVPDDFVARITEKRDNESFVRAMGVQVFQTSRDAIDIPAESTSLTKFARTAEEGAVSTNDPSFAQNNIVVHKWTKLTKFSNELLDDDASNLEDFYTRAVGRAMAQTEAYYVAIGSGTNQHQGIFEGGDTDGFAYDTSAAGTAITPGEIYEHLLTLKGGYRNNAAWLMDNATWAYIATLRDTSNWAWGAADIAAVGAAGSASEGSLYGKPVYLQDDIPVRAATVTSVMVGDPDFYALVERKGLAVSRNPYLYEANGQVGFFNTFRQGGKVLVEEAWCGGYTQA